jgi:head-tail adaptor
MPFVLPASAAAGTEIDAGELAGLRDDLARLLPDICIIQRLSSSSDGGGGFTDAWTDLATDVACRIAPVAGGETTSVSRRASVGGRIIAETTHVVTLPYGQAITEADRIVIADATYDVTQVRERGAWELHRRVEVKEAPSGD